MIHPGTHPESENSSEPLKLLATGEVTAQQIHPRASNYTFVVRLHGQDDQECIAIYKPQRGEAPLWDFPDGTLYKREYATYLMAQAIGWDFVPPTVVRDGPYGVGSMQLFIEFQPGEHYQTLVERYEEEFRRICMFDWFSNNADRKSGHCLLGTDGRIWGVDHGLTFHAEPKLRTVIWDFAGQPTAPELLRDMEALCGKLESRDNLAHELGELLFSEEVEALKRRLDFILQHPQFPEPPTDRRFWPWPWL